jgi:hypothetical protein
MLNRRCDNENQSGLNALNKAKYDYFDRSLKVMWTGISNSEFFHRKTEIEAQQRQSNSLKIAMTPCFYTETNGGIYP